MSARSLVILVRVCCICECGLRRRRRTAGSILALNQAGVLQSLDFVTASIFYVCSFAGTSCGVGNRHSGAVEGARKAAMLLAPSPLGFLC